MLWIFIILFKIDINAPFIWNNNYCLYLSFIIGRHCQMEYILLNDWVLNGDLEEKNQIQHVISTKAVYCIAS